MKDLENEKGFLELFKSRLQKSKLPSKLIFVLMGVAATLWFLIRVIPKPQRAGYPCMKTAAPIMSGFVLYIISLGGMALLFKKAVDKFKRAKYISAVFSIVLCFGLLVVFNWNDAQKAYSNTFGFTRGVLPDGSNNPMGTGFGVFPGRVAWVHNVNATNKDCPNTIANSFVMPKNNDQLVINDMADKSILTIGGMNTVKDSWDAIFKSFNKKKTGTESGYTTGQTIFIKVNNGQAGWAINSDMTERGNNSATGVKNAAMSNTTPATVLAFIRQLVDECGVPQNMIYVGEPMTHVYQSLYSLIHDSYPEVIVLDKENKTKYGRTTSKGWIKDAIKYSDKGVDMPDAVSDALMSEMLNADYLINLAALKAHARGGVTLTAKQHFGSHGDHPGYGYGSFHLHAGLISTVDNDVLDRGVRGEYGMYRVLTDLMGHEKLGLNTVLFVVDGLWGGIEATDMPVHWKSAPFNNDFPNSLFVSQDAVALESVCIDFLRAEADVNTAFKDRPFFPAVDDHLHQAATKANWATGITYDPEGDGTEMPASLGVHEHWNNATDKKYSKNLDAANGKGIELIAINDSGAVGFRNISSVATKLKVYPNPCTIESNIVFSLNKDARVEFYVTNMEGKTIYSIKATNKTLGEHTQKLNTTNWAKGNYIVVMKTSSKLGSDLKTTHISVN